jgi:hypothetical protein
MERQKASNPTAKRKASGGGLEKAKKKPRRPEQAIQRQCIVWFRCQYPALRSLLFHVPNGGGRSKSEGAIFKSIGVVAGVPDLLLVYRGIVVAFELKAEGCYLSDAQKILHSDWQRQGIAIFIVKSLDDFMNTIKRIIP